MDTKKDEKKNDQTSESANKLDSESDKKTKREEGKKKKTKKEKKKKVSCRILSYIKFTHDSTVLVIFNATTVEN